MKGDRGLKTLLVLFLNLVTNLVGEAGAAENRHITLPGFALNRLPDYMYSPYGLFSQAQRRLH